MDESTGERSVPPVSEQALSSTPLDQSAPATLPAPRFSKKQKIGLVCAFILLLLFGGALVYKLKDRHIPVKQFTNVYSFVPEKISKSAIIRLNLPEGVGEDEARTGITFSPEIKGEWITEEIEKVVEFRPSKPLRAGVYYAVNLDTEHAQMSGDFFVDEDPKIQTIFPGASSEAHEDTKITIVFNRPMVPLTTLSALESIDLPITITPPTPGKFKWISTRSLQFIPEETLLPSSDYTVEVKEGLSSVDGLPVAPFTHTFKTRPLRYEDLSSGQLGYRSPIVISFNQPVDLEETKKAVHVARADGRDIGTIIEYGTVTAYDWKTGKYHTEEDQSRLFVYQREDQHGRNKRWDFNTSYTVTVSGATPLRGTVSLTEGRNSFISIPDIVETVAAQSSSTPHARPDFMDPDGTVIITFYDDVDLRRSAIDVKGLRNIKYGERCNTDEQGNPIMRGSSCEMEPDTRSLLLSFDEGTFSKGESFNIELKKIYTLDGLVINADRIDIPLRTYPSFQIFRTVPEGTSSNAPLNELAVCSNSPISDPGDAGMSSYVSANDYIVFGRWYGSYLVQDQSSYNKCGLGEFETHIAYGLLPQTEYALKLSLIDDFGQKAFRDLTLRTGEPEEQYTRFHNMQKQYNVTTPGRTKLVYAAENLEYVDMHICRMSPERFLERTLYRAGETTPPAAEGCIETRTSRIDLPRRYWVNNYFEVNLKDHFTDTRGHYIITFTNPLYTTYDKVQRYDRTYVSVTNLAVGQKDVEYQDEMWWSYSTNPKKDEVMKQEMAKSANLYWVNNSQTLLPVVGARVTQYEGGEKRPFVPRTGGITDWQGIAKTGVHKGLGGAVISLGEDSAVITDWADTLREASPVQDASKTYVYTDRPIYRPGHTVYIRGIDRIGFDGTYEVWKDKVPLQVFDAQGSSIYDTHLEQSTYGTFATSVVIPSDAPLGTYRIEAFGQSFYFDVEEYVPAAFKLEVASSKDSYINGDTFTVDVQADYYFGVPLQEGTVSYSVTAQDYYFDKYTDEYFNFGGDWYYCYYCGYGDSYLFRGEVPIDDRGHAAIEKAFDISDYFDDGEHEGSKLVTVSITAKDVNGRSVSGQQSFVVHRGEFYLGARTDEYYTSVNRPMTLRVKTVDTEGAPLSIRNIEKTVYKVEWDTFKRQEVDGGYYYRSEKRLTEIAKEGIKTDGKGDWTGTLSFVDEGEYEVHLTSTDGRKNTLTTITNVYIYGPDAVSVPPNNNYELELEVDSYQLEAGDTGSLLIKSPYPKAKALITAERGTVYDYWVVDVTGGLYLHTFPIKDAYAPNVYVSALLFSNDPEVKYGNAYYEIGSTKNELSIDVTPNKTRYLPGEEVTLTVLTKNNRGEGVPAEVSIAVADLSVLALKGNPKKDPVTFFYNGFPLSVTTASNIKNILHEVDIPLGTKGGGGNPDDLAAKKRGLFKDTAFWEASVVTDRSGNGSVSFTLPDNLTTWQVESLGVTEDTKLGVDYGEFTTKKDLMAIPLKPRFIVPGDEFSLGAHVFNQTDEKTTLTISLESPTLTFAGEKEAQIEVASGESKTVYFDVLAPASMRAGEHMFTFSASNGTHIDTVEQTIPITQNLTYETVATANTTKDDTSFEYLYVPEEVISEEGGLTINVNATLAVFMSDALTYMAEYPYGCSEQLASALSTIGIMRSALMLPNVDGSLTTIEHEGVVYTIDDVVKNGLAKIYESQGMGGGFAYYKGLSPNLLLTVHVVSALQDLKAAGFSIREEVLSRAITYMSEESRRHYRESPEAYREEVILVESVLRKIDPAAKTSLTDIVSEIIRDSAFINEKISSVTLGELAILTAEGYSNREKDRVYDALKNRLDIDGRGAYMKQGPSMNWEYYETSIKNTALALRAFVAHRDNHEMVPNVLRWLLASRDVRGVWGNAHNTFEVVRAMTAYLAWQKETESHFSVRALLDGAETFVHEFSPDSIFESFRHFVPMGDLAKNKLLPLVFEKEDKNGKENNLYYDMTLRYYLPVDAIPPRDEGITITRELLSLDPKAKDEPVKEIKVGDVIRGKLTIMIPDEYRNVGIEDMIPAGFELVNFNLSTEDQTLNDAEGEPSWGRGMAPPPEPRSLLGSVIDSVRSLFGGSDEPAQVYESFGWGISPSEAEERDLYPTHAETHDDRLYLFVEYLSPGVYEYEYYLRALVPGTFQHLPARAEELYFPEIFGRTSGGMITITGSR